MNECENPRPCGHCMAIRLFMLMGDAEELFSLPIPERLIIMGNLVSTGFQLAARVSRLRQEDRAKSTAESLVDRAVSTVDGTNKK